MSDSPPDPLKDFETRLIHDLVATGLIVAIAVMVASILGMFWGW